MSYKRLPFPRYLNRPRLINIFETDELKFAGIITLIVFLILFFSAVPPFIILIVISIVFYISLKIYKKAFKNTRSVLDHFFYNLGLMDLERKKRKYKENIDIPYGFIKRFID